VEEVEVPAPPLLLQWVKTDQALLMLFSDGTVQVRAPAGVVGGKVQETLGVGKEIGPGALRPDQCHPSGIGELLWGPY
jgi:hypothetical protein